VYTVNFSIFRLIHDYSEAYFKKVNLAHTESLVLKPNKKQWLHTPVIYLFYTVAKDKLFLNVYYLLSTTHVKHNYANLNRIKNISL